MRKRSCLLMILLFLSIPTTTAAGQDLATPKGEITSQVDGQSLRGIVQIEGKTLVDGLISWEISFGYDNDTSGTWFLLAEGNSPITDSLFIDWDTTQITDGNYDLRLTLFLEGGRRSHAIIQNLRVRNYTPIETDTPVPTLTHTPFTETPIPSNTPSPTLSPTTTTDPPTMTPLPTNSLVLPVSAFSNSMMRGAAGVFAMFIIMGLYSTLKRTIGK